MSGTKKQATPLNEEQLLQKEAELQVFEKRMNTEREAFAKDRATLDELEKKLIADQESFEKEKADFETLKTETEADLAKRKADLDELEESLMQSVPGNEEETAEPEPGHEFTFEKQKYKFRDSSPKNLRIGGKSMSQQEIAKDKELLPTFIKSSHIEKIK